MNLKKCITIPLLSILILTGCKVNETYENAMEEGKILVAKKEYDGAKNMFHLALTENKNDREAINLYNQIEQLIEANTLAAEGKYGEAAKIYQQIQKMDSKSQVIKTEEKDLSKELNKSIIDMNELKESIPNSLIEVENMISNGNYAYAMSKLENMLSDIGEKESMSEEVAYINELIETVKQAEVNKANLLSKGTLYIEKLDTLKRLDEDTSHYGYLSTIEMVNAGRESYERWDKILNDIYNDLKKNLPGNEMSKLKEDELAWIEDKEKTAEEKSKEYEGGSMEGIIYISTLVEMTQERCYFLVETYMQ
ncbi:MAG: DUF1311 domain-containing protein [Bacilli bacterium]|nr:DUF1311 domain-containing protein [Bacilli bacterium]